MAKAAAFAAAATAALLALAASGTAHAQSRPIEAHKIILVGDSTMAVGSGWGGAFCARHVLSSLACLNLGRQGRSTSTYRAEGSWDIALNEMAAPDYQSVWVLIQFGHNDQPGKASSTDLTTEFPDNLRRYVAETRARGARPVLVTPLSRRHFKDGSVDNTLAEWSDAVRAVAVETDTPLIDLNASSTALVQLLGPLTASRLAPAAPYPDTLTALQQGETPVRPSPPALRSGIGRHADNFDYTHLGPEGAEVIATLLVRDLIEAAPDLRPHLVP